MGVGLLAEDLSSIGLPALTLLEGVDAGSKAGVDFAGRMAAARPLAILLSSAGAGVRLRVLLATAGVRTCGGENVAGGDGGTVGLIKVEMVLGRDGDLKQLGIVLCPGKAGADDFGGIGPEGRGEDIRDRPLDSQQYYPLRR